MKKEPPKTHDHGEHHDHAEHKPSKNAPRNKKAGTHDGLVGGTTSVFLILGLILLFRGCDGCKGCGKEKKEEETNTTKVEMVLHTKNEVYRVKTPDTISLDFKYELDTYQDSLCTEFSNVGILMDFPIIGGGRKEIEYDRKKGLHPPANRDEGDILVTCIDPTKVVWIKVLRVE